MKGNTIGIIVLIVVVIAAVIFVFIQLMKKAQNTFASSPVGIVFGARTVEGEAAKNSLMNIKWLTYPYAVKLNAKYNTNSYLLDYIDTTFATEISNQIKNANSKIPLGLLDDSGKALEAIYKIKNQVQAVQVVFAFFNSTGKNLNAGLTWLSDSAIIAANEYFKSLPTGVRVKSSNEVLTEISA